MTSADGEARPVLEVGATLGEGPVWDDRRQELLFVDISGEQVHTFAPGTGEHSCFDAGAPVGAVVLAEDGSLLLALQDRFVQTDRRGQHRVVLGDFRARADLVRFNDGKVDPWGRFAAGTMHRDQSQPLGALHLLWPDGRVDTILEQVTISNGLAWSQDRRTFYYIDTPTHRVDAFDVQPESGLLTNRRMVVEIPDGSPDGMAIDEEGALWVAIWDGARVDRYSPSGQLLQRVAVPGGGHVSSVAFGGAAMSTLYITTARTDLDQEQLALAPHAGHLFSFEASVAGLPPFRFPVPPWSGPGR